MTLGTRSKVVPNKLMKVDDLNLHAMLFSDYAVTIDNHIAYYIRSIVYLMIKSYYQNRNKKCVSLINFKKISLTCRNYKDKIGTLGTDR